MPQRSEKQGDERFAGVLRPDHEDHLRQQQTSQAYQHLYRFAIHHALTTALLDQRFDWSTRVASAATPAAALGLRATIDADALTVANTLAQHDTPDQLAPETLAYVQAPRRRASSPSHTRRRSSAGAGGGDCGRRSRRWSGALDALSVLEQTTPRQRRRLFDAGRPTSAGAPAAAGSVGNHVLVLRPVQQDRRRAGSVVGGVALDR